jgi:lipopolysaccharide exporter
MDIDPIPQQSVTSRVARGTGWVIAWRVVSRNLGLLSTLVLVRLLRPEDFGLVALATGFANTVDSLSAIGVQDALVRDTSPTRDMYDTAYCMNVLRGLVTAVFIAALAWPVADFFADPRLIGVMLALALMMLLGTVGNIGFVNLRRDMQFQQEFKLFVAFRVISMLVTIVLAFLWRDYWALVIGLLAGRIAAVPLSYLVSPHWPRLSLRSWRHLFGFSFWSWMGTMLWQFKERSDNIIIGRMLGTAQFGVFAIGSEFGALPMTEVIEPLGRALFSGFALLHRSTESPRRLYLGAVGTAIMLILPAGLGISMVADPMVRVVLGEQWLSAVPVIQIIAIACPASVFSIVSSTFLTAAGRPRAVFLMSSVSISIRIPLMIATIYLWGLQGAAIGVAVALVIDQGIFLWRTMRQLGVSVVDLLACAWRPVVASLAMVGCLGELGMAWTQGGIIQGWSVTEDLVARCVAGAVAYVIALILAWFVAGCPDGVERQLITTARTWLKARVRSRTT